MTKFTVAMFASLATLIGANTLHLKVSALKILKLRRSLAMIIAIQLNQNFQKKSNNDLTPSKIVRKN